MYKTDANTLSQLKSRQISSLLFQQGLLVFECHFDIYYFNPLDKIGSIFLTYKRLINRNGKT